MAYPNEGTLVTDAREIAISETWDTQNDWEAFQSATDVTISNGVVMLEEITIPDSGDLHAHYDWREASGTSTVIDQTGNGHDLSGSYSGPNATINGNQAGSFDGIDDVISVSFSQISQPTTIFAVVESTSAQDDAVERYFGGDSLRHDLFTQNNANGDDYGLNAGPGVALESGVTEDTSPHIFSMLFDGANSILRQDGTQIVSGDAGGNALDGFMVGDGSSQGENADFNAGQILIYPQDKSGIFTDVEAHLSDQWGITL